MPTRNVNLTDEQDAFVERMVKSGKYQNASEAMRDAVRGLQQDRVPFRGVAATWSSCSSAGPAGYVRRP